MFTSGGQTHTTTSTKLIGDISKLPNKRPRMDLFIDSANTQRVQHVNYAIAIVFPFQCLSLLFRFFDPSTDNDSLRWKDKSQTRHHTAGTIIIRILYIYYQEYISNALFLYVPIPTLVLFIQYYKGILAGMQPCGTIVLLGELFGSESVSQVYGNIHTFFNENVQARKKLSEYSLCMHART